MTYANPSTATENVIATAGDLNRRCGNDDNGNGRYDDKTPRVFRVSAQFIWRIQLHGRQTAIQY